MDVMPADSSLAASTGGSADDGPDEFTPAIGTKDSFDVDPPYEPDIALADLPDDRFLDRELSWLRFNERVLELAEDQSLPLLERTRFMAIFASNLDEFFMVRVAGLKRRLAAGVAVQAASGLMPREVLETIWRQSQELMTRHGKLFRDDLLPALADENIAVLRWEELDVDEQKQMQELFTERVFPVLTPLAVDPAHPFTYISGLSLNLAVTIRNPDTG
jgi:polyphosphate kinase